MNTIQKLIKEICTEQNIKFNTISNDWIMSLEINGKVKIIAGYKFDLNTNGISTVFDDKYATYDLLSLHNIPVIEHHLLYGDNYNENYANNYKGQDYVLSFLNKYKEIVIKKNNGTCGNDVFKFSNQDEVLNFYNKISNSKSSYSMCPFYNIENEYRVIVLNNQIKLIYKKILPVVSGNGTKTIKELLVEFNPKFFTNIEIKNNKVLRANEEYSYGWKFNLSNGSIASLDIDSTSLQTIQEIVAKVTTKFSIKFASIDIIKTKENKFYIMEINSGVMMKNLYEEHPELQNLIKEIYTEAVLLQFAD